MFAFYDFFHRLRVNRRWNRNDIVVFSNENVSVSLGPKITYTYSVYSKTPQASNHLQET